MLTPHQVRDAILESLTAVNIASKLGLNEKQLREMANNSSAALTGGCNVQLVDDEEMQVAA